LQEVKKGGKIYISGYTTYVHQDDAAGRVSQMLIRSDLEPMIPPTANNMEAHYMGHQMVNITIDNEQWIIVNSYVPPKGCLRYKEYVGALAVNELLAVSGAKYIQMGDFNIDNKNSVVVPRTVNPQPVRNLHGPLIPTRFSASKG
jgi:hypothetical protein